MMVNENTVNKNPDIANCITCRPLLLPVWIRNISTAYIHQITIVAISLGSRYEKLSIAFGSHTYPITIATLSKPNPIKIPIFVRYSNCSKLGRFSKIIPNEFDLIERY